MSDRIIKETVEIEANFDFIYGLQNCDRSIENQSDISSVSFDFLYKETG